MDEIQIYPNYASNGSNEILVRNAYWDLKFMHGKEDDGISSTFGNENRIWMCLMFEADSNLIYGKKESDLNE